MGKLEKKIQRLNETSEGYATKDRKRKNQNPKDLRTQFEFDQSQVIYSNAFRRMSNKSQMIVRPIRDHFRSRMVHTFEVKEIATTLGDLFQLNNRLISAIALGHDLGHTAFGHAGESALRKIVAKELENYIGVKIKDTFPDRVKAFHHASNSARMLAFSMEETERQIVVSPETIHGVLTHSWSPWKGAADTAKGLKRMRATDRAVFGIPRTYEAQVVAIADQLAAINHDTEDILDAEQYTEYTPQRLSDEIAEEIVSYGLGQKRQSKLFDYLKATLLFQRERNYGRKQRIETAISEIYEAGKRVMKPGTLDTDAKEMPIPSPGDFGIFLDIYEKYIRRVLNQHTWFCGRNAMADAMITTVFNHIWSCFKKKQREAQPKLLEKKDERTGIGKPQDLRYFNHFLKFYGDTYRKRINRVTLQEEEQQTREMKFETWFYFLYHKCKAKGLRADRFITKLEHLVAVVDFIAGLTDRYCLEIFDATHGDFMTQG